MTEAYPISWPKGWPRTSYDRRVNKSILQRGTLGEVRRRVYYELRLLKASNCVISTNIPLRNDGEFYASIRPDDNDPGVAIYFSLRGKPMVMARDSYINCHQNMKSIAHAVGHLRGLERHGGATMMERAFSGFAQLPPPDSGSSEEVIDWREVFAPVPDGLSQSETLAIIQVRYRQRAKTEHPDAGGTTEQFIRLNLALKQAVEELE